MIIQLNGETEMLEMLENNTNKVKIIILSEKNSGSIILLKEAILRLDIEYDLEFYSISINYSHIFSLKEKYGLKNIPALFYYLKDGSIFHTESIFNKMSIEENIARLINTDKMIQ